MVDVIYKFAVTDVSSYGTEDDARIFIKLITSVMELLVENKTIFPLPQNLPNSDTLLPHIIIGYEAFMLSKHIMKLY